MPRKKKENLDEAEEKKVQAKKNDTPKAKSTVKKTVASTKTKKVNNEEKKIQSKTENTNEPKTLNLFEDEQIEEKEETGESIEVEKETLETMEEEPEVENEDDETVEEKNIFDSNQEESENTELDEPKGKIDTIVQTMGISKKVIFLVIAVIAILVLVIVGIAVSLLFVKNTYKEVNVSKGKIYDMASGKGTIKSANTEILRSPIASTVKEVLYSANEDVKKGQLLVEFDTTYVNSEVEKYQVARENVREMLKLYNKKRDDLNVIGKNNGFITDINCEVGTQVKKGDLLAYYIPTTTFKIECTVRYSVANPVQVWQIAKIKYPGGEVNGIVYEVTGDLIEGSNVNVVIYVNTTEVNLSAVVATNVDITTVVGNVSALEQKAFQDNVKLPIYAKENGIVESININAGQSFTEGANIITLKSDEITAKIDELQTKETQLNRLVDANVSNINNYKIYANNDGIIASTPLVAGQTVQRDQEIVRITIKDKMSVNIQVTLDYITRIEIGQEVQIVLNGEEKNTIKGKVTSKDSFQIGKEDGYNVEVFLNEDNTNTSLLGNEVTVNIIFSEKEDAIYVPINAIIDQDGKKYVDVVSGSDSKERVEVLTGIVYKGNVEIVSGLKEGQKILEYIKE